jgi:hypothetical protein
VVVVVEHPTELTMAVVVDLEVEVLAQVALVVQEPQAKVLKVAILP